MWWWVDRPVVAITCAMYGKQIVFQTRTIVTITSVFLLRLGGMRSTLWWVHVCLSVGLSARITRIPHGRTSPMFMHLARGRGSVLLRRRCDTLCTSGFADDVMFSRNDFMARRVYSSAAIEHDKHDRKIPTKFCSTVKAESTVLIARRIGEGQSTISTVSLLRLSLISTETESLWICFMVQYRPLTFFW